MHQVKIESLPSISETEFSFPSHQCLIWFEKRFAQCEYSISVKRLFRSDKLISNLEKELVGIKKKQSVGKRY